MNISFIDPEIEFLRHPSWHPSSELGNRLCYFLLNHIVLDLIIIRITRHWILQPIHSLACEISFSSSSSSSNSITALCCCVPIFKSDKCARIKCLLWVMSMMGIKLISRRANIKLVCKSAKFNLPNSPELNNALCWSRTELSVLSIQLMVPGSAVVI